MNYTRLSGTLFVSIQTNDDEPLNRSVANSVSLVVNPTKQKRLLLWLRNQTDRKIGLSVTVSSPLSSTAIMHALNLGSEARTIILLFVVSFLFVCVCVCVVRDGPLQWSIVFID